MTARAIGLLFIFAVLSCCMHSSAATLAEALDAPGITWTTFGDQSWFAQQTNSHDGSDAAQCGPLAQGQTSVLAATLSATVTNPIAVVFRYRILQDDGSSYIQVNAGDQEGFPFIQNGSGWVNGYQPITSPVSEVQWLLKNEGVNASLVALLDDVLFVFSNTPVQFRGHPASIARVPATSGVLSAYPIGAQPISYQWQHNGTNIPGATSALMMLTNIQFSHAGWYALVASNAFGIAVSSNAFLAVSTNLSVALESSNLVFASSGDSSWLASPAMNGSAECHVGANQQSALETTVEGPGLMQFFWKLHRPPFGTPGILEFLVNSEVAARNPATTNQYATNWWTHSLQLPPGSNNLKWVYRRSLPEAPGEGAWLDRVSFQPDYPPVSLLWTGAESGEWNPSATNWTGPRTTYQDGDTAQFSAGSVTDDVFIGANGVSADVAPSLVRTFGNVTFRGGDIVSGSVDGNVSFTGYSNSLSFPGGIEANQVSFDARNISDGAAFHIGKGSIRFREFGNNLLQIWTTNEQSLTLENNFICMGTTWVNWRGASNATVRLSGQVRTRSALGFDLMGSDSSNLEIAGPVILDQSAPAYGMSSATHMISASGWRGRLHLNAPISDSAGPGTNRLVIHAYNVEVLIAATNSYSRGTEVRADSGPVVVLPTGTLGTGDVTVRGLHFVLSDARNISPSARLTVSGNVTITNRAKIRVASAVREGVLTTNGIFTAENSFWVLGDGSVRVPGANIMPAVEIISPSSGATVSANHAIQVVALPSDGDSLIERVEFFINGAKVGERTNAPFSLTLSNLALGNHSLRAQVTDDDGGTAMSEEVAVSVAPHLLATALNPATLLLEFLAQPDLSYVLEASPRLNPPEWMVLQTFPPESTPRLVRYTNWLSGEQNTQFFRLGVVAPAMNSRTHSR